MEDEAGDRQLWRRFRAGESALRRSTCPDANDLGAFLDGRLTGGRQEALERHLVGCDSCLEALLEARDLLANPPQPKWRPLAASLAVAAAVVLTCALGFFLGWRTVAHSEEAADLLSSEVSFGLATGPASTILEGGGR
ncbi:MAG: zf-HC2 domain-containing protein [Acidobacteria bacterium]|nr:zf-HC2 domain-containing protein [Acidobacteriota bacterium]